MTENQYIQETLASLQTHLARHPQALAEDTVKFLFQALLGVGHLLGSRETVEQFIARETQDQHPSLVEPLAETISPCWFRLNLRRAMAEGLTVQNIAALMLASHATTQFTREDVLHVIRNTADICSMAISKKELDRITEPGWLPSHSENYRRAYHPAYRLISADWLPLMPAICKIAQKSVKSGHLLVTLDGPCASGKTTLAEKLAKVFDAAVIHTDDFVVPHAKKTPERLAIPGGNCDWERLVQEVIAPWKAGDHPQYRKYDCRSDCLLLPEPLGSDHIMILEGSYCNLPAIHNFADVRLFMVTSASLRAERLKRRESPESLRRYHEKWIPLEDAYFSAFSLPDSDCIRIEQDESSTCDEN